MVPWAVLITGAVGVGGTALGAWLNGKTQTKTLRLSLDAENDRARLAEKRRIYARCTTAFLTMERAGRDFQNAAAGQGGYNAELNLTKASDALRDSMSELILIAPKHIRDTAQAAIQNEVRRMASHVDPAPGETNAGESTTNVPSWDSFTWPCAPTLAR